MATEAEAAKLGSKQEVCYAAVGLVHYLSRYEQILDFLAGNDLRSEVAKDISEAQVWSPAIVYFRQLSELTAHGRIWCALLHH